MQLYGLKVQQLERLRLHEFVCGSTLDFGVQHRRCRRQRLLTLQRSDPCDTKTLAGTRYLNLICVRMIVTGVPVA